MNKVITCNSCILSTITGCFDEKNNSITFVTYRVTNRSCRTKPNILWVITDDQRFDSVPAFNRMLTGKSNSELGKVLSPNVDRLASQGVTYINTFNQNPGCAPSRTIMHTGRYSHKTGIYGFDYYMPDGMDHWKGMVPQVLSHAAGYQTMSVGKKGLRYKFAKGSKQVIYQQDMGYRNEFAEANLYDWKTGPRSKDKTREEMFQFPDGEVLVWPDKPEEDMQDIVKIKKRLEILRKYKKGKTDEVDYIIGGVNPQGKDETRDGWFVRELETYLGHADKQYTSYTGNKISGPDSQKPLFAYIGIEAPHTPVLPPAEFRDQFKNIEYKIPTISKAELDSFPEQLRRLYKASASDHFTNEEKQQMIADYFAFTAYADYLVGKSVDAFVDYSEKAKRPWMVVYVCGDHGWRLNEHGIISKFGPYDTDLRDPIIIVSSDKKQFPANKVVTDFTQFVDMAPTFYAAAGIDIEKPEYDYLDGRDLAKVASGKLETRDYIIAELAPVIRPRGVIRTEDYKFSMKIRPLKVDGKDINWAINAKYKDIEPMFFDLRNDPAEINNLAFDPYYRAVIDVMRKKLQDISLGDGRIETLWSRKGVAGKIVTSNFAPGADDGKINVPTLKVKS